MAIDLWLVARPWLMRIMVVLAYISSMTTRRGGSGCLSTFFHGVLVWSRRHILLASQRLFEAGAFVLQEVSSRVVGISVTSLDVELEKIELCASPVRCSPQHQHVGAGE